MLGQFIHLAADMANRLFSFFTRESKKSVADFDEVPLPKLIFDRDSLQILAVNKAAVALYGYTHEEFLVMTIKEIRPVWELQKLARHINDQHLQGNNTGIWKHLKKNGDIMLVQVDAADEIYEGKNQRIVTIRDITPAAVAGR